MQDQSFDNIYFFNRKIHKQKLKMPHAHFHEEHELYYLAQGRTRYFIGNEIFLLEPGDFIFIPSHSFHKTESIGSEPVIRLLLSFSDTFAGTESEIYIQNMRQNKFIRLPREHLAEVQELLLKIENEYTSKPEDCEKMMLLYFRELLILLNRYRLQNITASHGENLALIQSVAKFISENPGRNLSLAFLSRQFGLTPSYLSRLFKSVTGIGISEHINISRITAAEKLLLEANLSISEVSKQCGFNDSNYFAAVFKKLKGITPKKYAAGQRK